MLLETLRLALEAIWRNALRSALTLLGVTIGVAAVIAMVTLGQGATMSVSSSITGLGSNLMMVRPGQMTSPGGGLGAANFRRADADAIARNVVAIDGVVATDSRMMTVAAGGESLFTTVMGTDNGFFVIRDWPVVLGREFTEGETRSGLPVCIIGAGAARMLFGGASPLGQTLRLKNLACRVVGVLEEKGGGAFGGDQDNVVVVPLSTFQRRIAGNPNVTVIYVSAESEAVIEQVKADITALLRDRRHLARNEENDFTVVDMREIASMLGSVMGILTGLLAAVASVSLLVGGIGIMNIMLVSVTERTREIGIRLAIGARESQVLSQFLVEAMALATVGGVVGIALGLLLAAAAAGWLGVPFVIDPLVVLLAFGFSGLVGVAFGFFPARSAARLDPIEALRHE